MASFISHHMDSVYVRLAVQIVVVLLLTLFYQGSMLKRILAMAMFVGFSIIAEGVAVVSVSLMGVEQGKGEEVFLLLLVEIFAYTGFGHKIVCKKTRKYSCAVSDWFSVLPCDKYCCYQWNDTECADIIMADKSVKHSCVKYGGILFDECVKQILSGAKFQGANGTANTSTEGEV